LIDVKIISLPLFIGGFYMDEFMIEIAKKLTDQIEKFLRACKAKGDIIIDDVLNRLEDLKKET